MKKMSPFFVLFIIIIGIVLLYSALDILKTSDTYNNGDEKTSDTATQKETPEKIPTEAPAPNDTAPAESLKDVPKDSEDVSQKKWKENTLQTFSSQKELEAFLWESQSQYLHDQTYQKRVSSVSRVESLTTSAGITLDTAQVSVGAAVQDLADDYSTTNIQVAGVDEADFIKNDGKYIYLLNEKRLVIVDAFPPYNAEIVSTTSLSEFGGHWNPNELYINDNTAVIFIPTSNNDGEKTRILVYNITNRAHPVLQHNLLFDGQYNNSRMIGEYVYMVAQTPVRFFDDGVRMPQFSPRQRDFPEIHHFGSSGRSYVFTNIVSLRITDGTVRNKVFLLGHSSNLFMSRDNLYINYQYENQYSELELLDDSLNILLPKLPNATKAEIQKIRDSISHEDETVHEIELKYVTIGGILEEWISSINPETAATILSGFEEEAEDIRRKHDKERQKTIVHKIGVNNGAIQYVSKGEVVGRPLNQFSMDEYNGYFRIATTTHGGNKSLNHLFVLDKNMKTVGSLEDLAKGERIYSTRFIGDRLYMVTFVQVDPLFVIDLSDPTNPQVLGELKIPGVSDYLHPYDANYLIGVGRSTTDNSRWVSFKGVKVSLFDVSDVHNPKEKASYEIGARGTSTSVIHDHRAFLFDKERELLVLPVTLVEEKRAMSRDIQHDTQWIGALVFTISPSGIKERGRITHFERESKEDDYTYNYSHLFTIDRSLYMDNVLYTISPSAIKANNLRNLREIERINLRPDKKNEE